VRVIDSSAWIEFFSHGPAAERVLPFLAEPDELVTPTIVLLEVYRKIARERGPDDALLVREVLERTRLRPLSAELAVLAADTGLRHGLATADAIVYATALAEQAELVTGDAHFRDLPGVVYLCG
jgi:predicted nucleic acid-binding protein